MKKLLVLALLVLFTAGIIYHQNQNRSLSRIVFCDVGQGDAIYLRQDTKTDVLIDAGPNSKVINCLNSELPFFDRRIEAAFLTHPDYDHFGGLNYVLDSFQIQTLYLPVSVQNNFPKDNELWDQVWQKLKKQQVSIEYLQRGDELKIGADTFLVLYPQTFSRSALGIANTDVSFNNLALGLLALVKGKQILLLSDLDIAPAESALEQLNLSVDIFKISHHGSKYGLSQKILELANPKLAVISVGKNNWYGHPHAQTIQLLQSLNIPIKRTDKNGKIVLPLYSIPDLD